jgi:hypothetical protein
MLAVVMSALAPTLAHAWVAAADDGQWIEVCSASGMVWLKTDGGDTDGHDGADPDEPMADMGKHCPWCSAHGSVAGLPPDLASMNLMPAGQLFLAARSDLDLHAQTQRSTQARAPPTAS